MEKDIRILYVEDVPNDAEITLYELSANNIHFSHTLVETKDEFIETLISMVPDIIISDYHLPKFDGMQALALRNEIAPQTPFILVTGAVNEEVAVECMKAGADDYILKTNLKRLPEAFKEALAKRDARILSLNAESKLSSENVLLSNINHFINYDNVNSLYAIKNHADSFDLNRENNSIQSMLITSAGIGTWSFNLADKKGYFDDMACQLLGFEGAENTKTESEFLNCIHNQDRKEIMALLISALAKKTVFETDFRVVWHNGQIKYLTARAKTLLNEFGEPVAISGLTWDITDHKLLHITLQENLRKTNSIINNLNGVVFRCKFDKEITMEYISGGVSELTGFPPSDFLMNRIRSFSSIIYADDKETVIKAIQESIKKGSLFTVEYRIQTANGSIKWLWERGRGVYSDGTTIALEGFIADITDRKKAEEDLKSSLEELRQLTQYIEKVREDERVAISRELHDDLGQALTAVKIDITNIKHKVTDDDALIRINKVLVLVSETIKTVQKITAQLRPQIIEDLGLEAAVEWYAKEFSERNNIKITLEIQPDIIVMPVASLTIFRIMQESLTNIARHSKATIVKIVLIKMYENINFSIFDNGIGIAEHELKSRKAFGILSMKERALSLGGTLTILPQNDKGTVINLCFPSNSI